jgi:hypothetical protein
MSLANGILRLAKELVGGEKIASAIGKEVYLDRSQARHFDLDYRTGLPKNSRYGDIFYVAASTLLRSKKSSEGYDEYHVDLLSPLGGRTLGLEGKGYGWFSIRSIS